MLVSLTPLSQQDMEIGRQEGSDWAMKEFQQRLRALRGGEEDSQTHTPAKKAKMVIAEGEAQGDKRVFLFPLNPRSLGGSHAPGVAQKTPTSILVETKQKADPDKTMQEALANAHSSPAFLSAMARGLADHFTGHAAGPHKPCAVPAAPNRRNSCQWWF